jgi:hypothetical protein
MSTYNVIVSIILNLKPNLFSCNSTVADIDQEKRKWLCMVKHNINKFTFLGENINSKKKEEFMSLFCTTQKHYRAFNRFAFICKYKTAKTVVTHDLQLNPINNNQSNVISIWQDKCIYLFKMEELFKYMYMALINNNSFFAEPLSIKNPYNNVPFGKSVLFWIYLYFIFHGKVGNIKTKYLDLFLKFKDCEFNMTLFVNLYEPLLREYSIQNYMNNLTSVSLEHNIRVMINMYNVCVLPRNQILIANEFPRDVLISAMKPCFLLYLMSFYLLIEEYRRHASIKLKHMLREFQKTNPCFGRKIIKYKDVFIGTKLKRVKSHIEFNTSFKRMSAQHEYSRDHLEYTTEGNLSADFDADDEEEEEEDDNDSIS